MKEVESGATMGMANSYNTNSKVQLSTIDLSIPIVQKAIEVADIDYSSSSPLLIADFGSAQGLNSIYIMKNILHYLKENKNNNREVLVVHNDLPTNDWTSLFRLLGDDQSYCGVASGRSFYEQCLPNGTLSIGYTSTSIHWFSKKPCNLSNHCICYFAVGDELNAFRAQARLDYMQFLEHRSHELHPGGVLVLANVSLDDHGKCGLEQVMDILYKCARDAAFTEQELLDYTIPFYIRSYKDFIDEEILSRYSFQLIQCDLVSPPWFTQWQEKRVSLDAFAHSIVSYFRGWLEPILHKALFDNGRSSDDIPKILDRFWILCEQEIKQRPDDCQTSVTHSLIILKKK